MDKIVIEALHLIRFIFNLKLEAKRGLIYSKQWFMYIHQISETLILERTIHAKKSEFLICQL